MSHSLRTFGIVIFVLAVLTSSSTRAAEVMTPGDLNLDSITNHDDFFQLLLEYDPWGPKLAPEADSNDDLRVDHKDVENAILGRLFGSQGNPSPDPSQTGVVIGVVLEDVGDALVIIPITGASVWIASEKGIRLKTTSGDDGSFHFEEVPVGSARVTARHPDYHKAQARIEVTTSAETYLTLKLAPKNVDLTDLSGFVSGALSNDLTQTVPLKGAAVRVVPIDENGIAGDFDSSHSPGQEDGHQVTFTDDQGHYGLHDLAAGQYQVIVSANGYKSEEREIEILSSEKEHSENFTLLPVVRPYGAVAGTVYSYDPRSMRPMDAPLAGARVVLKPTLEDETSCSCSRQYEAVSNEAGQYSISGVRPGKYLAQAVASLHYAATAEIVVVTQEKTLQDFHLEVILNTKGAVAGTVTGVTQGLDSPVPLEDALVSLFPQSDDNTDPATLSDALTEALRVRSVTTDTEGKYTFREVPAGNYLVIAWARGWGQATGAATVIPEATAVVDLQIIHPEPPAPASLLGTVFGVVPETLGLPVPIVGAHVIAIPGNSDWTQTASLQGRTNKDSEPGQVSPPIVRKYLAVTDDSGHYKFASLPPGSYRVIAIAEGYESAEQSVDLASGVSTQLDFYLNAIPSGPGIVLGTVFTTASGAVESIPIAGAKVRLVGVNEVSQAETGFETETNAEGFFEFAPVAVGTYKLVVSKEGFRSDRQRIEVEPGETVKLSIELFLDETVDTGVLEGHVWEEIDTDTNQVPSPIEGAVVLAIPVSFFPPSTSNLMGLIEVEGDDDSLQCTPLVTKTDADGYYRFDSVPAGTVAMVVLAEGYVPALDTTKVVAGETTVLDFYLKAVGGGHEHASLSGVITGHSDNPTFAPVYVVGAKVILIPQDSTDPSTARDQEGHRLVTYTNQFGEYEFPRLSAGLYQIKVQADGYQDAELKVEIPKRTAVRQDVELMPVETGSARLFGYVKEASTGGVAGPVADATVRLVPDDMPVIAIFPPPNVGYDRATDEKGYYLFESLPAKGYQVVVLKEGYTPTQGHVELEAGEERQADWTLVPEGTGLTSRLFGYVTEANADGASSGDPIVGATIRLGAWDLSNDNKHDSTDLIRVTDENGYYEFTGLAPGAYIAACTKDGYGYDVTHVSLAEGEEQQLDFVLIPLVQDSVTLSGVITEDVGVLTVWIPISGASIALTPVNMERPSLTTTSGPGGDYKFEDVPPGDYEISVTADDYQGAGGSVHLPPGGTVIKNFALTPVPEEESASLFGKVLEVEDNGALKPLEGATISMIAVSALAELNLPTNDGPLPPVVGYTDTSGADGSYDIGSLPPGKYRVVVWKDGYGRTREGSTHGIIELAAGDRKEMNWKLQIITETVSARFYGYVTEKLVTGEVKPLANALVRLIPNGFGVIAVYPPPYCGYDKYTDDNGYYDFSLVPLEGFTAIVLKSGYSPGHLDLTELAEGESLQKDFTLEAVVNYAKITVDVTEFTLSQRPGRLPIPNAKIKLVEADGDIRTGQTNEEGYRTFEKVTPGPFVISVTAEEFVSQTHTGTVEPGAAVTESFQLVQEEQGPAKLTGYVTEDMGPLDVWVPIEGALVSLAGVNTDEMPRITKTDEFGQYTFKDVSPREYDVTAQAEGFISETERITLDAGDEEYLSFSLEAEEETDLGSVTGTVTALKTNDDTIPVPGLPVRLRATSSDKNEEEIFEETTFTGLDGTYEFDEVPAGEYTLKVTIPFRDALRANIEVISGETTVQDFSYELWHTTAATRE